MMEGLKVALTLLLVALPAIAFGCSEATPAPSRQPAIETSGDELSASIAALADATEKVPIDLSQAFFANGESVRAYADRRGIGPPEPPPAIATLPEAADSDQKRKDVIAAMLVAGARFTERAAFAQPAAPGGPAQDGLAYAFGARDPWTRSSSCGGSVFGLDASGLVYRMVLHANIAFEPSPTSRLSAQFVDPSVWRATLPSTSGLSFRKVGPGEYAPGDLVFFAGGPHIAVVAGNGANPKVIQSNGTSATIDDCSANLTRTRGPNGVHLASLAEGGWFNSPPTAVLRLRASCPAVPGTASEGGECCPSLPEGFDPADPCPDVLPLTNPPVTSICARPPGGIPSVTGGAITDGIYDLTARYIYLQRGPEAPVSCIPEPQTEAMKLCGGHMQRAAKDQKAFSFTAVANQLRAIPTCGGTRPEIQSGTAGEGYTASGNRLVRVDIDTALFGTRDGWRRTTVSEYLRRP